MYKQGAVAEYTVRLFADIVFYIIQSTHEMVKLVACDRKQGASSGKDEYEIDNGIFVV